MKAAISERISNVTKRPRGTGSVYQMKGSAVYWLKYYRDGKPVRESSGSTKIKTAENLLKQRIGELAVGTWIAPQDKRVTVDSLWQAFIDDYKANGRRLRDNLARWGTQEHPGRMQKFFSGIRALAVSTDLLNRYSTECRDAGLTNATINRDMAALRRAFNLALRAGKIQKVPHVPHFKESAPRSGFVEQPAYNKLRENAGELWLRAMLATAYTFGFRRAELVNLSVSQVDLMGRTIRLNPGETKSGEGRTAFMTDEVFTLLKACVSGKGPQDHVFTRENGGPILDFRKAWANLTKAAGLKGLLFHDLRRSAVRNMVRRGIPERVAMRISGHLTRSVFERYNIVSESDLMEASRKIEAGAALWAENGQSGQDSGRVSGQDGRPN